MKSREQDLSGGLYALIAGLVVAILVADWAVGIRYGVWVLYFFPLALSFLTTRTWLPVALGFSVVLFIVAGYFLDHSLLGMDERFSVQMRRVLASTTFVVLGFLGRYFIRTRLRLSTEEWIRAGQVGLTPRMQGELEVGALARQVLTYLAEYLGAQVGSVYAKNGSGALVRKGGFGLEASGDDAPVRVKPGETLVGEAAASKKVLVVDDVPDGYVNVRSGVGAAKPRSLVLVPTMADGEVNGVVELGFFSPPAEPARDLLGRIAEAVGVALRSAEYRRRQAELLEETQRQAEELQVQQEELKGSNEELEAQSRVVREANDRLQEQQAELEHANRYLEEQRDHLSAAQVMLQRKAGELGRASQYKSEFLANMSHELRTPLNSALILARLLADNKQGNLTAEQVQYATNIYTAGNDLLTLINDILDLSKVEAGKLDLAFEPVTLASLFATLEQRFSPLAAEKKLALRTEIAPGCPETIETDPLRLQQVLTNLLSNALKFTERGAVHLRAERGPLGDVLLSVEDTGIGIPPHQHEIIFEAFRQADGTTNRKYGGTGLGLSISRELVDLLGGAIRLRSAPGQGSTFTVCLPERPKVRAASVEPRPAATAGVTPASNGNGDGNGKGRGHGAAPLPDDDRASLTDGSRVVLVVEDDAIFAGILRSLAHELSFQCVIARDAAEGLALVRELAPLAILLDVGLPDHSGLAVLEQLKRDPAARHIPIHVISVHDYQRVAREMGAVGYALKPTKREELLVAFRRLEDQIARKARAVLVVEDDPVQRDAIAALLGGDGVTLTSVASAAEAFAKLESETFDCVVLDLMLPTTSGFEVLERMSKDERLAFPPVIVYTARALTTDEEQRLRRHAKSIIVKGARSPERLLEEVTLFLHQVEADLPPEKRKMLRAALDRDAIFTGRRILVVEDDVRNIYALTSALEPKGAVIEIARNGREALARIRVEPRIDLVLMDLMMPEMDGLTATRELRKEARTAALPIIALTAKAMPDDRQACLDAGANDYIAKPIELDKLISLVRVWMPR